ncbi:MAG: hypothetical protein KDD10_25375, partial [Phaeodactylibacter sp.]|nr:hypothetical protein [Phaeodactylibacter sp.]
MKTSETKTASQSRHSQPESQAQHPFFSREPEGNSPFFGAESEAAPPFFETLGIQPKLTVGQPNDKYEREADATADRVVRQLEAGNGKSESGISQAGDHRLSTVNPQPSTVQPKCVECEAEEQEQISPKEELGIQRKPIFESSAEPAEESIQPKLQGERSRTLQLQETEETPEEGQAELQEGVQLQPQAGANPADEDTLQAK